MEQHSISNKSAFLDFYILFDHFNGNLNYDKWNGSEALKNISETYELRGKELQLITHLANIFPDSLLYTKIAEILKIENFKDVKRIVNSLHDNNFIRTTFSSTGLICISLTEDAVSAFDRYQRLDSISEFDFIDIIRRAEPYQIESSSWIKQFTFDMDCHKDSDFVKKWNALGAEKLSKSEKRTFCAALRYFILNFTSPMKVEAKETTDEMYIDDDKDSLTVKQALDSLVQSGLIVCKKGGYVISPKVAEALFHGHDEIVNYNEVSKLARIIKSCDIEKRELFFACESQEEIEHLHHMLSKKGYEHACSVLIKKKRNPAIQSLLWGGPGTGKTETVKQIALESGRDIFLFDAAKVTESEWGATENLYRSLFDAYRYIVAVKSLTPILFINEADQILSRRLGTLDHGIDKSENTISNILLQEFEDMHGILLATTNNVKILDEAFDRRFLFKTELQKPDARARKAIWKSMIPELTEQEAGYLAENYEMSGAQINNVATKRDLAELYFHGDRGLSYIEDLCSKELSTEKQNSLKNRIGF